MNKRPLAVQLLATLLCLALPSASMAQLRAMEPAAPAARAGAAPVPALTALELQQAVGGDMGLQYDQWSRVAVTEPSRAAGAASAAASASAFSRLVPAFGRQRAAAGEKAAPGATSRAFSRIQHLIQSAENVFATQAAGPEEAAPAAPAAPEGAPKPHAAAAPAGADAAVGAPAFDAGAPTAKLVLRLRELAETDPQGALALADRLLASDRRLEVRLAAVRVAGSIATPAATTLLTRNMRSDASLYLRRESAKQLGRRAESTTEGRAEAIEALRQTLRETVRPRLDPGMHDSLFHMAAWALPRFGESVEGFVKDRAAAVETREPSRWVAIGSPKPSDEPPSTAPDQPEKPEPTGLMKLFSKIGMRGVIFATIVAAFFMEVTLLNQGHKERAAQPPTTIERSVQAPQAPEAKLAAPAAKPGEAAKPAEQAKPDAAQSLADIAKQLKAQNDRAERLEAEKKAAEKNAMPGWLGTVLYLVVMVAVMIGLSRFMQGQQMKGAAKMGQFKIEAAKPTTRFDDVAGADDARTEIAEIVDFLRNPRKFKRLGGKVPKGALLVGPPGTGKTLLARAVAGETGANFYTVSGSDFVEMFVGVGAARVRELFETAKQNAPAIIFIDEIDAIGKKRGGGIQSNDERENTLNQLLTAMDGFDNSSGVVVLAATNREDVLDPALLRPGRFDRKVHVGLPDVLGREAILQVHANKVPLAADADLELVAKRTAGLSGAFLQGVINEGALEGSRRDAEAVGAADLDKGIAKNTIGGERPNMFVPAATKKRIAEHEIGHVLVGWYTTGKVPYKVTAIPHGAGALGYAESAQEDEFLHTEPMLKNRLAVLMGGRAAEKLLYGDYSSGADNDLEVATRIARAMVQRFGMGRGTGFAQTSQDPNTFGSPVSEQTKREVDLEVRRLIDEAQERAMDILKTHLATHELLSKRLLENETMFGEEIERVAGKR